MMDEVATCGDRGKPAHQDMITSASLMKEHWQMSQKSSTLSFMV